MHRHTPRTTHARTHTQAYLHMETHAETHADTQERAGPEHGAKVLTKRGQRWVSKGSRPKVTQICGSLTGTQGERSPDGGR